MQQGDLLVEPVPVGHLFRHGGVQKRLWRVSARGPRTRRRRSSAIPVPPLCGSCTRFRLRSPDQLLEPRLELAVGDVEAVVGLRAVASSGSYSAPVLVIAAAAASMEEWMPTAAAASIPEPRQVVSDSLTTSQPPAQNVGDQLAPDPRCGELPPEGDDPGYSCLASFGSSAPVISLSSNAIPPAPPGRRGLPVLTIQPDDQPAGVRVPVRGQRAAPVGQGEQAVRTRRELRRGRLQDLLGRQAQAAAASGRPR